MNCDWVSLNPTPLFRASQLFIYRFVIVGLLAVAFVYNQSNSGLAYRFTQPSIIPAHNNSSGTAGSIFSLLLLTIWCFNTHKSKHFETDAAHTLETFWNLKSVKSAHISQYSSFCGFRRESPCFADPIYSLQFYTNNPEKRNSTVPSLSPLSQWMSVTFPPHLFLSL